MMAKAGGKTFERELVSACNRWYIDEGLAALAYRRWAPPRTFQEFDVGSKREAYMCPWHEVKKWRRMFAIGVRFDRIRECPQIRRVGTQYEMDSDVLCLD